MHAFRESKTVNDEPWLFYKLNGGNVKKESFRNMKRQPE
jgi:hypothetical protein